MEKKGEKARKLSDVWKGFYPFNEDQVTMKQGAAKRRVPRRDMRWGPGLGVSRKY